MQRLDFSPYDDESREKVGEFLKAAARNSERTGNTYSFALKHFSKFLDDRYGYPTTIGNITVKIKEGLDVYVLLDSFVSYLIALPKKLAYISINNYVGAIRSYLQHYDVEINPYKLKHRVHMPKEYHEEEQAIDQQDIREMLKACNNRRLKPYLYLLASGGMRANEALALRLKDVDFSESPTKVHISKENKTKRPRDIFISDEATKELRKWIDYKYGKRRIGTTMQTHEKSDDHLIFTLEFDDSIKSTMLYSKINEAFHQVLKSVGLNEIKEGSHNNRREITLNSFRRFVRTTLSDQVSSDYAEWFIGHVKSTYWTKKPEEKREIYASKCMKVLTFLDFSGLVTRTKNIESRLNAKDKEIEELSDIVHQYQFNETQNKAYYEEKDKEIEELRNNFQKMERVVEDNAKMMSHYFGSWSDSYKAISEMGKAYEAGTISDEDKKVYEEMIKGGEFSYDGTSKNMKNFSELFGEALGLQEFKRQIKGEKNILNPFGPKKKSPKKKVNK